MRHQAQLSRQVASDATTRLHGLFVGAKCWHVSAGGVTWPAINVVLGEHVPRARPLTNPAHPERFRSHDGSRALMAWSSWTLRQGSVEVVSSVHAVALAERARVLEGRTITGIRVDAERALHVDLDDDLHLVVRGPSESPEPAESWSAHAVEPDGDTTIAPGTEGIETTRPAPPKI